MPKTNGSSVYLSMSIYNAKSVKSSETIWVFLTLWYNVTSIDDPFVNLNGNWLSIVSPGTETYDPLNIETFFELKTSTVTSWLALAQLCIKN